MTSPAAAAPWPVVIPWVSAAVGMSRFSGSLVIQPGSLTFEPSGKFNEWMNIEGPFQIVHSQPSVDVFWARLLPPHMNSTVVLRGRHQHGGDITSVVMLTFFERKQVVAAMQAAGFEVEVRRTWFSLGAWESAVEGINGKAAPPKP